MSDSVCVQLSAVQDQGMMMTLSTDRLLHQTSLTDIHVTLCSLQCLVSTYSQILHVLGVDVV